MIGLSTWVRVFKEALDWVLFYVTAWALIVLSPLWFPVWLARKLYKWTDEG